MTRLIKRLLSRVKDHYREIMHIESPSYHWNNSALIKAFENGFDQGKQKMEKYHEEHPEGDIRRLFDETDI